MDNKYIEDTNSKIFSLEESLTILQDNVTNSNVILPDVLTNNGLTKDLIYKDFAFLLRNLRTLLKSHNVFLNFTTHNEKKELTNRLNSLQEDINSNNYENIVESLEYLRTLVRNFRVFTTKSYIGDYYKTIKELNEQENELKKYITKNQKDLTLITNQKLELENTLTEVNNRKTSLEGEINKLQETYNSLENSVNDSNQKMQEIETLLSSSKSKEELIRNFSVNVEKSNQQLIEQQAKLEEYDKRLIEYQEQQSNLKNEAEILIESAKDALKYKTAEGISAAMQEQYTNSKEWKQTIPWILLSIIMAVITFFIGYMLFIKDQDYSLQQFLGRALLLLISTSSMIFSAKQYIKQKNIIEDYAYKQVLAKSLVGLSEEFAKDRGDSTPYVKFMTRVQEEILQDPLRNRNLKEDNIDSPINSITNQLSTIKLNKEERGIVKQLLEKLPEILDIK